MDEDAISIRPDVADTVPRDPRRGPDGRTMPRRLGIFTFLRSIPGLWAQFSEIPGEYWALDVNGEGFSTATVSCPCGGEPVIEVGAIEVCECERAFLFIGRAVHVANSPKDRQPETPRWQRIARSF